ncbi:hypothetical protein PENFLA_c018G04164 [Penicillium flavigenum]|uniref:Secreted protein n=1 Tax=Penicillium flavigenum TaxID=254877 RepID=A0A1V6T1Z0_9EURO|nr:hypothetical protein PENFLA_c018G04164 [Penicillium flavigenum]
MSWDWRSTLITLIALSVSPTADTAQLKRLGEFFCARVRACWRRLLLETDPRATPDLEQNPDGQEHELDDLTMVICHPSPLPPSPSLPAPDPVEQKEDGPYPNRRRPTTSP